MRRLKSLLPLVMIVIAVIVCGLGLVLMDYWITISGGSWAS